MTRIREKTVTALAENFANRSTFRPDGRRVTIQIQPANTTGCQYPTCIRRTPRPNILTTFGTEKLEWWIYQKVKQEVKVI